MNSPGAAQITNTTKQISTSALSRSLRFQGGRRSHKDRFKPTTGEIWRGRNGRDADFIERCRESKMEGEATPGLRGRGETEFYASEEFVSIFQ